MSVFAHRLLVVLGKGGTGRTTLSVALALAAAEQGKSACVLELGDSCSLPQHFGMTTRSFAFRTAAPGVDVWSVTVDECVEDFGARKLRLPGFARKVLRNRLVRTFVDAVPGLHDLLLLGKIENLISEPRSGDPVYDVMILDAPATGHGWTLLQAARTMTEMTRAGPFFELAHTIEVFLADPSRTGLVVCTLPEQLPVHETLELIAQLQADGFQTQAVFANQVAPAALPHLPDPHRVNEILADIEHGANLQELVDQVEARHRRQAAALQELADGLRDGPPIYQVPYVAESPRTEALGHHLAGVL